MKKARIMVVEDEAIIAMELRKRLLDLGFDVPCVAHTGEKALIDIEDREPDLVLMDINLSGEFDGVETAAIIRQVYGIPVIFCTGYGEEEVKKRANGTCPCGYLIKPFEDDVLQEMINRVIKKGI